MNTATAPDPSAADRQQLIERAGEWLAGQDPYPRPVIASLVSEFELNILEACTALRRANEIRDRLVSEGGADASPK